MCTLWPLGVAHEYTSIIALTFLSMLVAVDSL